MHFASVHVAYPYTSIDTATVWKTSRLFSSARTDFCMIDNLSIAVHTFTGRVVISLLIDGILQPRYVNWSSNFRGLPL